MKKPSNTTSESTNEPSPWLDEPVNPETPAEPKQARYEERPAVKVEPTPSRDHGEYDLEGLMNDFPTATEMERFVYDQTGLVLNLKGRPNKLKYTIAMEALNGAEIDPKYLGNENPYVDRAEMIPVEPLKEPKERDPNLPDEDQLQNTFTSNFIPHPDGDYRARNRKVQCIFRKYKNGMISYEVVGPIEPRAVGEKMDKFGKLRPELMTWVDPRTGEQVAVRRDGTLTPQGRNLRAIMQKLRVNNSNQWQVWVDREFVELEGGELMNPWGVEE